MKTLSRAETNRRITPLSVDSPWKNLAGQINGCNVNAWATGPRCRISRISICALPRQGNAVGARRLALNLHQVTGLEIHWHSGMIGQTINQDGSVVASSLVGPYKILP